MYVPSAGQLADGMYAAKNLQYTKYRLLLGLRLEILSHRDRGHPLILGFWIF